MPQMAAGATVVHQRFFLYDEAGRLRETYGHNGQRLRYARHPGGELISVTDSTERVVARYAYDAHWRVASVTDANNGVTRYTYDSDNRITSVMDPKGLITSYGFDGLGRLLSIQSPDTGTTTYTLNAHGQRTGEVRADGTNLSFAYRGDGRLSSITSSRNGQSLTRSYVYDSCSYGQGRLCSVSESNGESISYSYTALGALAAQTDTIAGQSLTTRWDYDNAGQLSRITYPNGTLLNYSWQDGLPRQLRMQNVGGSEVGVASNIQYQPTLAVERFIDRVAARSRSYDYDGRLSASQSAAGAQTFGYNSRDLLTTLTGADISSVGYDLLDRVNSLQQDGATVGLGHDANGNRLSASYSNASSASYSHGTDNNRLIGVSSGTWGRSLQYDAAGNLRQDQRSGFTFTDCHGYDAFVRLIDFRRYGSTTACTREPAPLV